jgi:antibiotic biosynthesis monooxygenase (ABM) superfamily enzyme
MTFATVRSLEKSSIASSAGQASREAAGASASASAVAAARRRFSRPRFALLVLAGVYPLITALLYIVLPLLDGWSIWQETLLIAPLMVTMMVWGVIPTIQTRFQRFINPSAG